MGCLDGGCSRTWPIHASDRIQQSQKKMDFGLYLSLIALYLDVSPEILFFSCVSCMKTVMGSSKPCEREIGAFLHTLGITAVIVTCLIQVPQLIKIIKTRETRDLSAATYFLILLSGILWSIYHIEAGTYHGAVSGTIGSIIAIVILFYIFKYKRERGKEKVAPQKSK